MLSFFSEVRNVDRASNNADKLRKQDAIVKFHGMRKLSRDHARQGGRERI